LIFYILGRTLNVEMSLGKPRSGGNNHGGNNRDHRDGPRNFDRDRNKEGTVKLHVAGVGMNPDTEKIKKIFGKSNFCFSHKHDYSEEYGKVSEVHSIPNRDIVFVHIDEKAPELAMIGLTGKDYEGKKLKIEYGTLQDKPTYDKRAPKVFRYSFFLIIRNFRQNFTSLICQIVLWISLKSCVKSLTSTDLLKKRK
jgi:hypothetical protein